MKIRLLSDLHRCINKNYPLELDTSMCDYTLIAGDLGPDYRDNAEWLKHNMIEGAFVSGNHDAYTHDNTPVDDVKEFYHKEFPLDNRITYFDSDVDVISKEIGDNILLIADVMYTDYKLKVFDVAGEKMTEDEIISRNMFLAKPKMSGSYMNDFNFFTRKGKYEKSKYELKDKYIPEDVFYIQPENYKEHFEKTFSQITDMVENNPSKDIILMTHHCLSEKCISREYNKSTLNASYVSPKDNWIRKHTNIKLILSGHVHCRKNFKIGSTRYVLNPLGYIKRFEHRGNKPWTPNCFVDTKTWKVTFEKWDSSIWSKQENEEYDKFLKYAALFI